MSYYDKIFEIEGLSTKEKKELQERKLKKLLLHAYKNVPYYTKILPKAGVIKEGKVCLENFSKIPVLTKDILTDSFEELKSKDIDTRRAYKNHSGGSSGEPTEFFQDKKYFDWGIASSMYFSYLAGHDIGEKSIRLWGSERDLMGKKDPLIRRIKYFFFNRVDLNAFKMSQTDMRNYVERINKIKPVLIEAYVRPLYEFACFIEKNNLKVFFPKTVITSAGTLYPEMKEKIEEVFNTKIWNQYGSREVGGIAIGCKNLKMAYWHNYVEILNKDMEETKELGRVYVTTLDNYSMPLIRYDIGDIAQFDKTWPYLKRVEGREVASFKNRKGKIVPGLFFVHFLGVVMNDGVIKQFQMIQKDYEDILIKVVIEDKEDFEKLKEEIEDLINKAMETECHIKWKEVKNIPPLKSGKFLYIKSEVD